MSVNIGVSPGKNSAEAALDMSEVSFAYGSPQKGGEPILVLDRVSLTVARGESISIIGPSGSGKSTFLSVAGTLLPPDSGRILIGGSRVDGGRLGSQIDARRTAVGFVFQDAHLMPQLTVFENVLIPTVPLPTGSPLRESAPDRCRDLLIRVGLESRLEHRPYQLSGGERQRVALVRALTNQPVLVLADEPTGSIDRQRAREIVELLLELCTSLETGLVIVTHDLALASRSDRVFALEEGHVAQLECPSGSLEPPAGLDSIPGGRVDPVSNPPSQATCGGASAEAKGSDSW